LKQQKSGLQIKLRNSLQSHSEKEARGLMVSYKPTACHIVLSRAQAVCG
jgi:hypothetical protein